MDMMDPSIKLLECPRFRIVAKIKILVDDNVEVLVSPMMPETVTVDHQKN